MEYVSGASDSDECIFCSGLEAEDDGTSHILHRGPKTFVILNAFPYNPGHLMVAPNRHAGDITDLEPDERAEVMEMTSQSVAIVRDALAPDGFNIGVNLGRVAGAGIPGHWHVHVVPRWDGDTNFMPVVGQTKVLPEMLADTDAKLRP
ncbi:MAG: HIT family protein, partial [Actinomycetota bacterium]